jgi:hypothetical protein
LANDSEEHVDTIVKEGAVEALVPHLCAPTVEEGEGPIACEHEVEKDAAFALGLLAVKVSQADSKNHRKLSVDCYIMFHRLGILILFSPREHALGLVADLLLALTSLQLLWYMDF